MHEVIKDMGSAHQQMQRSAVCYPVREAQGRKGAPGGRTGWARARRLDGVMDTKPDSRAPFRQNTWWMVPFQAAQCLALSQTGGDRLSVV